MNKSLGDILKMLMTLKITGAAPGSMSGICYDSRMVSRGDAFVALPGMQSDGHDYIKSAVKKGARAIIAEHPPLFDIPGGVTLVLVPDTRKALSKMSDYFFDSPSSEMSLVGITGTNGKTTVSYMIKSLLDHAGRLCSRIGTTGYDLPNRSYPAINTTPESYDLHKMLRESVDAGARYCALEVSSHALTQGRVDDVKFRSAVFTNLTQDHLDYHETMSAYFSAKALLFTQMEPEVAIINIDDPYASKLMGVTQAPIVTYGEGAFADISAEDVQMGIDGISFRLKTPNGDGILKSKLTGKHNLKNLLAASAVGIVEGLSGREVAAGLLRLLNVPGRFEKIEGTKGFSVVVDYAHTDDALKNVIRTARELVDGKVITLFGCGGDRDKTKRAVMGKVAAELSDSIVITSDNPRTEDPGLIIDDIISGIGKNAFDEKDIRVIPDRRLAIKEVIAMAGEGDLVLIAGKGHEIYQIVGTRKSHFDDREEAKLAIKERNER